MIAKEEVQKDRTRTELNLFVPRGTKRLLHLLKHANAQQTHAEFENTRCDFAEGET